MSLPTANDSLLLLHNPKCSKSRATKALLEERGAKFETRLYLDDPLDRAELIDLGQRLGKVAVDFTRTKQAEFSEAGLSDASAPDEILAAMERSPILMERPILVSQKRAIVGRPPEDVLELLGD